MLLSSLFDLHQVGYMDASLIFELNNEAFQLEAEKLESGAYYVIFKDQTAGVKTYPSGRYMVTEIASGDSVYIDFNRAYNPPCAFTDHATCPLPTAQNILETKISAGEIFSQLS